MKKFIHISGLAVLLLLAGCKNEDPGFPSSAGTDEEVGYIVTSGLSVSVADNEIISTTTGESSPTKSESSGSEATHLTRSNNTQSAVDSTTTKTDPPTAEASDDYKVTILNTKTSETMNYTYADLKKEENQKIAIAAAEVEAEGYCKWTRVEEIIRFARKIGAQKIGIATCVGLIRESAIFANILEKRGFQVYGIGCKVGAMKKVSAGIPKECDKLGAVMCNPIMQAKLLEKEDT